MTINILDYCTPENASGGVKKAIADALVGDTILFEKNEYHFYKEYSECRHYHMTNTDSFLNPKKYFAILMEDKENITIDGNGSVFVIHGDICALSLVRCKNIKLKNFTVRYNCPTNFEMTVIEKKKFGIKYSIPNAESFCVKNNSIYFYEQSPFTKEKYYSFRNKPKSYCNVLHNGDDVHRTQVSPFTAAVKIKRTGSNEVFVSYIVPPALSVGDTITMSNNRNRSSCGLFFWECSKITSENIIVNYMHGFGWLSQMCEDITFDKISFKPADGYKVSSFADCIHICGCRGKVKINGCYFTHSHDDGINIHGAFLRFKEFLNTKTAVFEFVHKQQGGYSAFFKGDKVKFYSRKNLQELGGIYTVKSCVEDIEKKIVIVTFEEKLPQMEKNLFVCENITYNPEVEISNCTFRAIPTRGILCTTDKESKIYNNKFISLKMPDIYISCDCRDWYESGPCKNMKIYNNIFSQKNPVVLDPLCIFKPVDNVHQNIQIYDNKNSEN